MTLFGNETTGSSEIGISNLVRGGRYTIPEGGVGESMSAMLRMSGSGTEEVRLGIYDDIGGNPPATLTLIAETDQSTINNTTKALKTIDLTSSPVFVPGTSYFLCGWAHRNSRFVNMWKDAGSFGDSMRDSNTYTPPNSYPAEMVGASGDGYAFGIYVTYEPAAGGAAKSGVASRMLAGGMLGMMYNVVASSAWWYKGFPSVLHKDEASGIWVPAARWV